MSKKVEKVTSEMVKEVLAPEESSSKTLIYCGPNYRQLQQYSVFKGKLPGHIQKMIIEFPLIKNLFVKPKELPHTRQQLKIKGTKEYQLFQAVVSQLKGVNMREL